MDCIVVNCIAPSWLCYCELQNRCLHSRSHLYGTYYCLTLSTEPWSYFLFWDLWLWPHRVDGACTLQNSTFVAWANVQPFSSFHVCSNQHSQTMHYFQDASVLCYTCVGAFCGCWLLLLFVTKAHTYHQKEQRGLPQAWPAACIPDSSVSNLFDLKHSVLSRYMAPELFDCKTKLTEKIDVEPSHRLSSVCFAYFCTQKLLLVGVLRSQSLCVRRSSPWSSSSSLSSFRTIFAATWFKVWAMGCIFVEVCHHFLTLNLHLSSWQTFLEQHLSSFTISLRNVFCFAIRCWWSLNFADLWWSAAIWEHLNASWIDKADACS